MDFVLVEPNVCWKIILGFKFNVIFAIDIIDCSEAIFTNHGIIME
jgi:hypothetical protein